MGFKLRDLTKIPTDDENIAKALREVERELDHVREDGVWSREPTDPGLFMMLEDCVGGESWGIALSIAFTLGRVSIVGKNGPAAIARAIAEKKAQCRAGKSRAVQLAAERDARWRIKGEEMWRKLYANLAPDDPNRITVEGLAVLIRDEIAGDIKRGTIERQIGKWNKRDGIKPNTKRRPRG